MKTFVVFAAVCLAACSENPVSTTQQPLAIEPQLRSALCQLENGDGPGAQATIEKVLAEEPGNIFAKRLLPGASALMIKEDDTSPENIDRIKEAAEAYLAFSMDQSVPSDERDDAVSDVIALLLMLPDEMASTEFSKLAEDIGLSPKLRSSAFVSLAAEQSRCASENLSESGKPSSEQIERARSCIAKGTDFANRAVELDPNNESAWTYKGFLLNSALSIAKAEKDSASTSKLPNEISEARERSRDLRTAHWQKLDEKAEKEGSVPRIEASPKITESGIEDLVQYTEEKPLEQVIPKLYFPMAVRSFGDPSKQNDHEKEIPPYDQPREWKEFSPTAELTLDLPDDAAPDGINIFHASGNGASYLLISPIKAPIQVSATDDMALNILAWSTVDGMKGLHMRDDKTTKFEVNLLNKDAIGGRPARAYALKSTSCAKTIDGTLLLIIGSERNYSLTIFGASYNDPRVERVVRSIKFNS